LRQAPLLPLPGSRRAKAIAPSNRRGRRDRRGCEPRCAPTCRRCRHLVTIWVIVEAPRLGYRRHDALFALIPIHGPYVSCRRWRGGSATGIAPTGRTGRHRDQVAEADDEPRRRTATHAALTSSTSIDASGRTDAVASSVIKVAWAAGLSGAENVATQPVVAQFDSGGGSNKASSAASGAWKRESHSSRSARRIG
jgi:hypothetical protein